MDSGFVVVDRFFKMRHIIPCKTSHDTSNVANLFFKEVVRIHHLPRNTIANKDAKFMGHVWKNLWKRIGNFLAHISPYHPQTNGQIEVINKVLGNLQRCLTTKYGKSWEQVIP